MHKTKMHPEILTLLKRLRTRIRRYVLLEGGSILLALICMLFWISLLIDIAYFKFNKLELPVWFRVSFDVFVASLICFALMSWIGLRLMRRFRLKALALVLERRFPELNDRLLTAVELAETASTHDSPLTQAMLRRTVEQVARDTQNVSLNDVFKKTPLRRSLILASVFVVSIGSFAVADFAAVDRWKRGFLDLAPEYWNREYQLNVTVIAQPGDVQKSFQPLGGQLEYKHPRGSELVLQIEVPEDSEQEWKIPDQVELRYRLKGRYSMRNAICTRTGDRTFRHSLGDVMRDAEVWVIGGDFTNREPYRIRVVDPPRVDRLTLDSFYPSYTGLNSLDDETTKLVRNPVPVLSNSVSLPMETEFLLHVRTNKSLVRARIVFGDYELTFGKPIDSQEKTEKTQSSNFESILTQEFEEGVARKEERQSPGKAGTYFGADNQEFMVPFVLSTAASPNSKQRIERLDTRFGRPIVLRPDTEMRIYMEDTDDIISREPATFKIIGTVDTPPSIETKLKGIGTAITRIAKVPIAAIIRDDYGIGGASFEFRIDDEKEWHPLEFLNPPKDNPLTLKLRLDEDREYERFDLTKLFRSKNKSNNNVERTVKLTIGQKLTVSVVAFDTDNLNGPHTTRSDSYRFRIISNEDLLSILYQKELNLRRRFEQVIEDVKNSRKDLTLHLTRVLERDELRSRRSQSDEQQQQLNDLNSGILACAERALHGNNKNSNETATIEFSFGDIREELINNGVANRAMLLRFERQLIEPLHAIVEIDYARVDRSLRDFHFANQQGHDPSEAIGNGIKSLSILVTSLERVLAEMKRLATIRELQEMLKSIKTGQQELSEKTKAENKKKLIRELGLDDE